MIAGTSAWAISVGVLGPEVALMAPWTALLTVHATVHRSLSRGAQTAVSSAVGMGLAFVIMNVLGVNIFTFALALFIGLMGARLSWIRDEGVAIATTAIFIFTADDPMFADRFIELLLGVAIGILVNVLVLPPCAIIKQTVMWTASTSAWVRCWRTCPKSFRILGHRPADAWLAKPNR